MLYLLKYFIFYDLYVGIGCAFLALHIVTALAGRLHWIFWPDVDVKFINPSFIYEEVSARFCFYVIFLWPIRALQILTIFAARIVGLFIIAFVAAILLIGDFVV